MPHYSVSEDQGVAGPLTSVSAETTTLFSCMGIMFYSSDTRSAGLYHYGAGSIRSIAVQTAIRRMFNDVETTAVYVTAPALPAAFMDPTDATALVGSSREDRDDVKEFLEKTVVDATVEWLADGRGASYWLEPDGVLRKNAGSKETAITLAAATLAKVREGNGRFVFANIRLYLGE